jgi:hypothetical protein
MYKVVAAAAAAQRWSILRMLRLIHRILLLLLLLPLPLWGLSPLLTDSAVFHAPNAGQNNKQKRVGEKHKETRRILKTSRDTGTPSIQGPPFAE